MNSYVLTVKMRLAIWLYGLSYRVMPYPYNAVLSKHLDAFIEDVRELNKGEQE